VPNKSRGKKAAKKKPKKLKRRYHGQFHVVMIMNEEPYPYKISVKDGDRVAWVNLDGSDWYVQFLGNSPFVGHQNGIPVPAGDGTAWIKANASTPAGQLVLYSYALMESLDGPLPPPDGPGVISDGG
jgi:hypothetical protein